MSYTAYTDQELVRLYLEGEEKPFEILLNRHQNRVYNYIYMMVKDNDLANDVFQDVFIKVIQTLKSGKYNEEGKFLPWVMRISHNLVIDYFRKEKKMPKASVVRKGGDDEDSFDIFSIIKLEDVTFEDQMVLDQIYSDVRKLVEYLPDEQKEVVMMRHYQDMSFKEISDKTGVSINTALGRMRYALINLRKMIKENDMIMTG